MQNCDVLILFSFFRGISVLNTKSELERVMEKRNRHRKEQERVVEEETKKSPFQKMLEDRAKRLEMIVSNWLHSLDTNCNT